MRGWEGSEMLPSIQVTSSARKWTLKHPFFCRHSTWKAELPPSHFKNLEKLAQPSPQYRKPIAQRRQDCGRCVRICTIFTTCRRQPSVLSMLHGPWGFVVTPLSVIRGVLDKEKIVIPLTHLGAASSNRTEVLWSSDDVWWIFPVKRCVLELSRKHRFEPKVWIRVLVCG